LPKFAYLPDIMHYILGRPEVQVSSKSTYECKLITASKRLGHKKVVKLTIIIAFSGQVSSCLWNHEVHSCWAVSVSAGIRSPEFILEFWLWEDGIFCEKDAILSL